MAKKLKNRKNAAPKKPVLDFGKIADDFRYLNPNDPGTWALVPRITALLVIFVLVLALAWGFIFRAQTQRLDSAVSAHLIF